MATSATFAGVDCFDQPSEMRNGRLMGLALPALIRLVSLGFATALLQAAPYSSPTFLHYKWEGGLSRYSAITIRIDRDGHAEVVLGRRPPDEVKYETDLSTDELEGIRKLLQSTGFFTQPDKDSQFATDQGQTELTVSEGTQSKKLIYSYRPALQPLTAFLYRLVAQVEAIQSLQEAHPYEVWSALDPRLSGSKVLQPAKLKQPLLDFIRAQPDQSKRAPALCALAHVTTPEEFAAFLAAENGVENRMLMLDPGNLPKAHRLALCPLFLAYLQSKYSLLPDYEKTNDDRAGLAKDLLGELGYAPAIPFFLQWFEESSYTDGRNPLHPLSQMGLPSLRALQPQLNHKDAAHRQAAIDLLASASNREVRFIPLNPIPQTEYAEMKKIFVSEILPKLNSLASSDSSENVRADAKKAIGIITTELSKPTPKNESNDAD
jgi:hypothetical protein